MRTIFCLIICVCGLVGCASNPSNPTYQDNSEDVIYNCYMETDTVEEMAECLENAEQ